MRILILLILCVLLIPQVGWGSDDAGDFIGTLEKDELDIKDIQRIIRKRARDRRDRARDRRDRARDSEFGSEGVCQHDSALKQVINVARSAACKTLPVGKFQRIDRHWYESETGVEQKYILKRTGEKSYEITLNLWFQADKDYNCHHPVGFIKDSYGKILNACLEQLNPYLKGPDGEQLKIKFISKSPMFRTITEDDPPNVLINLGARQSRSNSRKYACDIDCPTMLHEILHLTGLVDEYKEKVIGVKIDKDGNIEYVHEGAESEDKAYNCRALGPTNSIMSNHYEAHVNVLPSLNQELVFCSCSEEVSDCKKKISREIDVFTVNQSGTGKCPDGFKEINRTQQKGTPGYGGPLTGAPVGIPWFMVSKLISTDEPKKDSILLPAHFNALLYPSCNVRNRRYFKCAAFEMKSGACMEKPRYCFDAAEWLN